MKETKEIDEYFNLANCDFKSVFEFLEGKVKEKICVDESNVINTMNKLFDIINDNNFKIVFNYEKWKEWKDKKGIDPDDSKKAGPNPFMCAVYYILWGKRINLGNSLNENKNIGIYENGWQKFSKSYLLDDLALGGETMNTIKTYQDKIDRFWEKDKVDELCRANHQMGNFVLVPAYFNVWKGRKNSICNECMDKALFELKYYDKNMKDKSKYSFEREFKAYQKNSSVASKDEKWELANEHFESWKRENFKKFINIFFLWDYIYSNEKGEYCVKDLKLVSRPDDDKELKYEVTEDNVGCYIKNAVDVITRRNNFMAGMLMIAIEFREGDYIYSGVYKDEWSKWDVSDIYKYIMDEVFLADNAYPSYMKVIEEIEKKIKEINDKHKEGVKNILKELKKELK